MPLWGNKDAASNSTLYALSQVKKTANSQNQTNLFGNVTAGAIKSGVAVGQFGVDVNEARVGLANVISYVITSSGSGYIANAAVTIAGGGGSGATSNATANSIGRISAVNANQVGSGYTSKPSVTVAAPSVVLFAGNTANVNTTTDVIEIGANAGFFVNGDIVTYTVAAGNTAIGGLTNNAQYYIVNASSTTIQLSLSPTGSAIDLTSAAATAQAGHGIQGQTATAAAVLNGGETVGATAGWNLRTVGTGGRAGRVQYECLVAMRSISTDASDDTVLPDS